MLNKLMIAISGKSGCGNTTLGKMLANDLNLTQINYTFRNLATDEGTTFEDIRKRAEETDEIDKLLDKRQIELAMATNGCVLGSRLAIWKLQQATVKVFLDISLDERSRRIALREGKEHSLAKAETSERDRLDTDRYKKIYNLDNNDFVNIADIVISDDKLSSEQIANLIKDFLRNNNHI